MKHTAGSEPDSTGTPSGAVADSEGNHAAEKTR